MESPTETPPALWPHQEAAISATLLAMRNGTPRGMIVLPTGTGKTATVLTLGARLNAAGPAPVLMLVDRDELLQQTLRAARRYWPAATAAAITAGSADWDEPDCFTGKRPDFVVGMVQTVRNRLKSVRPDRFALVVADECHLYGAPTYAATLDHFTPGLLLGLTATPARHDGKPLDRFGTEPLYTYSAYQATKDGRVVPMVPLRVATDTDLDAAAADGEGDFVRESLAGTLNTSRRNAQVVDAYREHGQGRRFIGFSVDVDHAEAMAAAFRAEGIDARGIHGGMKTADRRGLLAEFAAGKVRGLFNCDILTTGFDDPGVSCILMSRPIQSRPLYVQMVGRGLRLAPGKADCLVIDFADVTRKHKLVCAPDLAGRKKDPRPEPETPREPRGKRQRLLPLADGSFGTLRWHLERECPWPELPTLEGYLSEGGWRDEPASDAQAAYLSRFGLELGFHPTKGEASWLIDRCREYECAFPEPASAKQRTFLKARGLWTDGMGKRTASRLITEAKKAEGVTA